MAVIPLTGVTYCKNDSKRVLYAVFAGGAPSDISLFYILDRRGKFLAWLIEVVASSDLSSFRVLFQGTSLDDPALRYKELVESFYS